MKESIHKEHQLLIERDSPDDSSDDNRSLRGRGYPNERGRIPGEKEVF